MVIHKVGMIVITLLIIPLPFRLRLIAPGTQIISVAVHIVEALNTSEVQPRETQPANAAPEAPGLDDVVKRENFHEVQGAVVVPIQIVEEAGADPLVAGLVEKCRELVPVNLAVAVCVHGLEEAPC